MPGNRQNTEFALAQKSCLRNAERNKTRAGFGISQPTMCPLAACFFLSLVYALLAPGTAHCEGATVPKAAIIDHLSLSWPNPDFIGKCTDLLKKTGYAVDYYKGKQVTVELYRRLPTLGYKLIILRVHSAYIPEYLSLAMFTSEPYSRNKYIYEQLRNRVASGYLKPYHDGDPKYLVITDKFVRFSMEGSFDDTLVIMMGCTGIKRCAANAFLEKGAAAYIGWTGPVSAPYTDRATLQVLERLLVEKQSVSDAVIKTMRQVGPEQKRKSTLLFWPIGAASYTVGPAEKTKEKKNPDKKIELGLLW